METINSPDEIKTSAKAGTWSGYGAVFENIDDGNDIIKKGAFVKMLTKQNGKIRVPLYHDLRQIIGEAEISQDNKGLKVNGELNMKLSAAADTYELMLDGSVNSMSVGFNVLPKGSTREDYDSPLIISKAELWEVSLVAFGMNRKAKVTNVKSILDDIHEIQDPRALEKLLRHVGFTRKQSVAITAGGFKALAGDLQPPPDQSDSGAELSEMLSYLKQELAN